MAQDRETAKRWPLARVDGEHRALDLLKEIILAAAKGGAPNFDLLVHLATDCCAYDHDRVSDKLHAEFVRQARDSAVERRWALAEYFLKHRGGSHGMAD